VFSVAVYTLGCKLNQLESEALADAFRREGFSLLSWDETALVSPELLIINTCTVTSRADQKARRIIRKALRDNPCSLVMVTGCYAQLEPEVIEALEAECMPADYDAASRAGLYPVKPPRRRLFVLKGKTKGVLLDLPRFIHRMPAGLTDPHILVNAWLESLESHNETEDRAAARVPENAFRFLPREFSFHTRGSLKIQDGCDNYCTYCRVRLARGPSVSLSAGQALAELRALEAKGYAEVILTGVNITQYRDCCMGSAPGGDLGELLGYLLKGTRCIALRLSSLDPQAINRRFVSVLAHQRIRPHFHLSVQSGSAVTLKKMGRNYGPETVEQAAALLRSVKDSPFLACDIITGFPGETETEFEKTLALCRNIGFDWIHAFPYSRRPGTAASSLGEPVSERDAARRVEILLKLARQGRRDYVQRWLGRETDVLVERGTAGKAGYCKGVSENYLKLLVKYSGCQAPPPGTVLRCRIGKAFARTDNTANGDSEYDSEAVELVSLRI
jgi:threonylcarbamoyladenosine tRNA methylthiotransferase MtaB